MSPWNTLHPAEPMAVAEALLASGAVEAPVELRLVTEKHIGAYSAWLWRDGDGRAFFSKAPKAGLPFVWATRTGIAEVLRHNRSLKGAPTWTPTEDVETTPKVPKARGIRIGKGKWLRKTT